jgi:hypothetical protein
VRTQQLNGNAARVLLLVHPSPADVLDDLALDDLALSHQFCSYSSWKAGLNNTGIT